jgi:hypothetical protein
VLAFPDLGSETAPGDPDSPDEPQRTPPAPFAATPSDEARA